MYDTPDELLREILTGEDSRLDFKEVVFKGAQIRFVEGDVASLRPGVVKFVGGSCRPFFGA